jgi:hypothetical protein
MEWSPQKWNWKGRTAFTVLGPELTLAPAAALGVVYCSDKFFPHQLEWLQGIVSEHVVQPHLTWFESRGGSLRKAHEDYDRKKREQMIARGEPVEETAASQGSPKERADLIAGVLVKGIFAMGADLGITLIAQNKISKWLKVSVPPKIAFAEHVAHLGGIAVMAGPGAGKGEEAHYWIKHHLQKLGMGEQRANDWGVALPYIVFPGQLAALGSLAYALTHNGRHL